MDASPREQIDAFPSNIVVLATHGSYFVPDLVRSKLSAQISALLHRGTRNFSDFASRKVIPDDVPPSQKVVAGFSRAIGDPNRATDAPDLFRETDFNGMPVWETPLTSDEKRTLIDNYHEKYHDAVLKAIETAESKNKRVIVFDMHDTGNLMMSPNPEEDTPRENPFPQICLGDKDGESCDPVIMQDFAEAIERHLGMKPQLNDPYKGGFVTTKYGKDYNDSLPDAEKFSRNVIQIELGRFLYVNEKTQKPDRVKIDKIKAGLRAAMKEVGDKYGH